MPRPTRPAKKGSLAVPVHDDDSGALRLRGECR